VPIPYDQVSFFGDGGFGEGVESKASTKAVVDVLKVNNVLLQQDIHASEIFVLNPGNFNHPESFNLSRG
jgi:hypothetical protein